MTPNDYIEKAKHAIETGQPNLAMLYMQRGIEELDQRRWVHMNLMFGLAFNRTALSMNKMAFAIQDVLAAAHVMIAGIREANRASIQN